MRKLCTAWAIVLGCWPASRAELASAQRTDLVPVRGHVQSVHLYGVTNARPVIVSSGDGGWIHLGPHVAQLLAAHGCFVVGFDVKAYLTGFSDYANQYSPSKPILIGISEGAGLSVLAASDSITQRSIAGVIAIGLPDRNELAWRWRDSLIYLTHGIPNEPTFSAASLIGKVSPLPLAMVHSTHDEFVPLTDAQRMMALSGDPKRLWVVDASDHRFSNNLSEFDRSLLAAIDWVTQHAPR
jgi:hypothetical protein